MIKSLQVALLQVRIYLQDIGDLGFSLLLPVLTFALMYGAFGGQTMFHGTAHIVNEDQGGAYSEILIERLEDEDSLDVKLLSAPDADSKLDRSDLLMVMYIPDDFSEKIGVGEQAQLLFKQRGNGGDEGQIVASIIGSVADRMAQESQIFGHVTTALAETDISQEAIHAKVQGFLDSEQESTPVEVQEETLDSGPDPVNFFLPGILTMFVLFAVTMTARSIVEERKKGTLERLLTTNLTVGQLFMGKFFANCSRGLVQTLILLILAYVVFQLSTPLSFFECLAFAIVYIAAVSSLGLIIASIVRTEDQATWLSVFFTMTMVVISGTFFEITEGSVMDTLSKISVNTYANDAFRTIIAEEGGLADVGIELAVLAGVAVVGLFVSRILFSVVSEGK